MLKTTALTLARLVCTNSDENELNMDSNGGVGSKIGGEIGDKSIKNLSNVEKLAKSTKIDFTKTKSSRADFLTLGAKKTFIYLQKAFIKVPIFYHLDIKHHIFIKTDTFGYAISRVISQITSDKSFSHYVTFKESDPFISKIS